MGSTPTLPTTCSHSQSGKTPASQAGVGGFESPWEYQYAGIAQVAERLLRKQEVAGSIPAVSSISGCSSDGRARGLGPRVRWFEPSHTDQFALLAQLAEHRCSYAAGRHRFDSGTGRLICLSSSVGRAAQSYCEGQWFESILRYQGSRIGDAMLGDGCRFAPIPQQDRGPASEAGC